MGGHCVGPDNEETGACGSQGRDDVHEVLQGLRRLRLPRPQRTVRGLRLTAGAGAGSLLLRRHGAPGAGPECGCGGSGAAEGLRRAMQPRRAGASSRCAPRGWSSRTDRRSAGSAGSKALPATAVVPGPAARPRPPSRDCSRRDATRDRARTSRSTSLSAAPPPRAGSAWSPQPATIGAPGGARTHNLELESPSPESPPPTQGSFQRVVAGRRGRRMGLPTAYRLAKALGVPLRAFQAALELTLDEREERRRRRAKAELARLEAQLRP